MFLPVTLLRGVKVLFWLGSAPTLSLSAHDTEQCRNASVNVDLSAKTTSLPNGQDHFNEEFCESCLTNSWMVPSPTSYVSTTATQRMRESVYHRDLDMDIPESISATSDQDTSQGKLAESVAELVAEPVAEPVAKSFMSFEDWKEIMLRRTGQDPQNLGFRKPSERVSGNRYLPDSEHAGFGEEGEISLNFETYTDNGGHGSSSADVTDRDNVENEKTRQHLDEDGKAATVHLSKDAGKTCKERFSYSSFDAGATVLKTSPGAKNAKAILVENKDTYMLLECDSKSKYVIIELSDDISVDTIVLANFEFFSSMVRHFRVSVSDRYPVKMEKWRELGIFEARNSRDIQPFLVENPQIWAKYVRIEFLSHFGNEYYCPISLLRIHGSRMLDSWKDSEPGRDEDASADMNETTADAVTLIVSNSLWEPVSNNNLESIVPATTAPTSHDRKPTKSGTVTSMPLNTDNSTRSERRSSAVVVTGKTSVSGGHNGKPRITTTSGAWAATPTMQEGFFNAITKRLQHVETNLTLSLKYVEEQSKHVQEALHLREQKQQAKISLFLDDLNKSMVAELSILREQYDQVWQSMVLAMESQRDRTERDLMALSTRLNLLADEVVFQKRMAIVQAVVLLSCLFLIIFSRGIPNLSAAPLFRQASSSTGQPKISHGSQTSR
ncbi:hypothetical protein UVI_02034530 [Ustilaginoidea virens]|uniref:SUN domain-containing protein n=1 Tax=Ustilaginoidea virens TaxID=1159556 RepID=A0A1B5L8L1_USTVR|nr:hypothetical protein UVI_02034530 [Ustilaginoidea virens]